MKEGSEVGDFRDDINMVVNGYMGRVTYAEAIGILFGIASDLASEARSEHSRRAREEALKE